MAIRNYQCTSYKKLLSFLAVLREMDILFVGRDGECFKDIVQDMMQRKRIGRIQGRFFVSPIGLKTLKRYSKFCENIKCRLDEARRKSKVICSGLSW